MIAWLWRFIVGDFCRHEWETDGKSLVDGGPLSGSWYRVYLRCKKCGDWKVKDLT